MLTKADYDKRSLRSDKTSGDVGAVKVKTDSDSRLIIRVLVIVLVALSFFLGKTSTELYYLKKQNVKTVAQAPGVQVPANSPTVIPPSTQPTTDPKIFTLAATDHILGKADAKILLFVYSDLECPFSKRFQTTINKIADDYKNKIAIVYRHFPLDQIHKQTRKEAQATECAAKLAGNDGFWKLTDKIYATTSSNDGLDLASLPTLASQVGLDKTDFQSCLDNEETAQLVEAQYQSGVKAGVNGTPGSFLVDTKTGQIKPIAGAQPYEQIKPIIDSLLASRE